MHKCKLTQLGYHAGKRYDSYAENYDKLLGHDYSDDIYLDEFIKHVVKGGDVLDIGCGPGRDLATLLTRGFKATGIDTSAKMLTIARKHAPQAKLTQMDAVHLHFPDISFDGVLSYYALIHLSTDLMLQAFGEIYRVLKPGAPFLLVQCEGNFEGQLPDLMAPGKTLFRNFRPRRWLEQQLTKTGFTIAYSTSAKLSPADAQPSSDTQCAIIARKR
jgi:ubiquinone/menaquinone biosynthesis C-methylase UbiE